MERPTSKTQRTGQNITPQLYCSIITKHVSALRCCLFGTMFGCACTGYAATFGPVSGLRTLVVARYTMGYWPSKLCVVLNIVIEVGYGLIDCLVAGLVV